MAFAIFRPVKPMMNEDTITTTKTMLNIRGPNVTVRKPVSSSFPSVLKEKVNILQKILCLFHWEFSFMWSRLS